MGLIRIVAAEVEHQVAKLVGRYRLQLFGLQQIEQAGGKGQARPPEGVTVGEGVRGAGLPVCKEWVIDYRVYHWREGLYP